MRKPPLYSRSPRPSASVPPAPGGVQAGAPRPPARPAASGPASAVAAPSSDGASIATVRVPWRRRLRASLPYLLLGCGIIAVALGAFDLARKSPRALTQKDIDAAVLHTLENNALPSMAQRAYAAVRPSVVHVRGLRHVKDGEDGAKSKAAPPSAKAPAARPRAAPAKPPRATRDGEHPRAEAEDPDELYRIGIGTGVVIVSTGLILTNLHVIDGAEAIVVTFADGSESPADVVNTQPENDLAVLKARTVPDDLPAATLRSTADLSVGDEVVAIGFPFGIGPSASSGIVSGMKREYRSPERGKTLTNLIQFDAAANPGNSGGPLVTADGEVVGIVTGIFNPTDQRVFIGIGFAVPIENAAAAVGLSPF